MSHSQRARVSNDAHLLAAILRTYPGLREDEYAAIGRVAVESAHLEWEIELAICNLAKLSPEVAELLIGGTFRAKAERLKSLFALRLSRREARLEEGIRIMDAILVNNTSRTLAIHGTWRSGVTLAQIAKGTNARTVSATMKQRRMSLQEARDLADKIAQTRALLSMFMNTTWPRLGPRIKFASTKPTASRR